MPRGDRSIGQVTRDFDLTETAVREWVRQGERDKGIESLKRNAPNAGIDDQTDK